MEEIKNKLLESGLKPNSATAYLDNIRHLNGSTPRNINFLNKFEDVMSKLKDINNFTKKNRLMAIIKVLQLFPRKKKLLTKYVGELRDTTKTLAERPKKDRISWEDIKQKYEDYQPKNYNESTCKTIASMYIYLPPRRNRDYQLLKIANFDKEKDNYIDLKAKKLFFNDYKTDSRHGEVEIKIPDNLLKIIKKYIKERSKLKIDSDYLFIDAKGQHFKNQNKITDCLNNVFGKTISSTYLRHSYLESKYANVINEMENDARKMSHDLNTQRDAYVKK